MKRHMKGWLPQEIAKLNSMRNDGADIKEIAQALHRSPWSIKSKLAVLHAAPRINPWDEDLRPEMKRQDLAFQWAMTHAIESGAENASFGRDRRISKPTRPIPLVSPAPEISGCSSAAGLCADMGVTNSERWPVK